MIVRLLKYSFKFLVIFCLLYYGTLAVIGFSVPGGYYSPFVKEHLDYISLLRSLLLRGSSFLIRLAGYKNFIINAHVIKVVNGRGVRIVYSCLGYGVMSFWGAFVAANNARWLKKAAWILGGWLVICLINMIRISLLVISLNNKRFASIHLNHHLFFNFFAYIAVFILIILLDRSQKNNSLFKEKQADERKQ